MSSENRLEDFRKTSRRLLQTIGKSFLCHREDFFNLYEDFKKTIMMPLPNYDNGSAKTS
jgi:hypothetical protein